MSADPYSPVMSMPSQAVEDYKAENSISTLRFIATQWNTRQNFWNVPDALNANQAPVTTSNGAWWADTGFGFAAKHLRNSRYIYGDQTVSEYGFFIKDYNGNDIQVPMFRGMDVTKYYNIIDGEIRDMTEPLPRMINVSAYSEGAVSKKKFTLDALNLKARASTFFEIAQTFAGVQFNPVGQDFVDGYGIATKLSGFQHAMEIAYQRYAKHVTYSNDYFKKLVKGGDYMIISNLAMMDVYEENGKIVWNLVPNEQAIFDTSKNDDQHESDDFAGQIFQLSEVDCLNRYDWAKEEMDELSNVFRQNETGWGAYNTYNAVNNLRWFFVYNGVKKVTAVKGRWRSLIKENGEWIEVIREGELVANKWLKNAKISDTQVFNKHNKGRKQLGYVLTTPNTIMGATTSIVDMIKRFQDLKDALTTKMIDLVSSSIGKSYFIRASKLPQGMRTPDLISQLKQAKIVILEEDQDSENEDEMKSLMEPVDLSIDPGIKYLLELIQYYDNYMGDILNIPAAARGIVPNYQPKDVLSASLAQSNKGLKWFYTNYMLWIKNILEYSADLAKIRLPETMEGRENLSLVIGDAEVSLLSIDTIREMQFEDFLLSLDPEDVMTEQNKSEIKSIAATLAANGGLSMGDYIRIKRADSMQELQDYFDAKELKQQQLEQQQQQEQIAANERNADKNAQAIRDAANTTAATSIENTEMKGKEKIMLQAMKDNAQKQPAQV